MSCPTPYKRSFPSKAKAHQFNVKWHSDRKARLWAYECVCGAFHLTNQNPDEQKRIGELVAQRRRAIKGRRRGEDSQAG